MFSFEFCEICNNIYFVKPLRAAASVMCHLIKDLTTATATDTTNAATTVSLWEITWERKTSAWSYFCKDSELRWTQL